MKQKEKAQNIATRVAKKSTSPLKKEKQSSKLVNVGERALSVRVRSQKGFANEKKTFLSKMDKSRKGGIDVRAIPLLDAFNSFESMYTTSSCSGRVYLWRGSGKKNETEWVRMSHDPVESSFFELGAEERKLGVVWVRFESSIFHICCDTMETANWLLLMVRGDYKRSAILSASNKIIVEIRGGDIIEMPLFVEGNLVFSGDILWLTTLVNSKMDLMWKKMDHLRDALMTENMKRNSLVTRMN